jgi:microcystin-dependent protein
VLAFFANLTVSYAALRREADMSEPFLSEIKIMSFNFPPKGWALCNGQLLPINQNQALFSLLGTTYGGDGRVNFALPDLRGRVPIHMGNGGQGNHTLGEKGGSEAVTINIQQLPEHNHLINANTGAGNVQIPNAAVLTKAPSNLYGPPGQLTAMNPGTITSVGGSQAHTNMEPYLVLNFCIALQGIFPSQN